MPAAKRRRVDSGNESAAVSPHAYVWKYIHGLVEILSDRIG
jgi:hypothetical protein